MYHGSNLSSNYKVIEHNVGIGWSHYVPILSCNIMSKHWNSFAKPINRLKSIQICTSTNSPLQNGVLYKTFSYNVWLAATIIHRIYKNGITNMGTYNMRWLAQQFKDRIFGRNSQWKYRNMGLSALYQHKWMLPITEPPIFYPIIHSFFFCIDLWLLSSLYTNGPMIFRHPLPLKLW